MKNFALSIFADADTDSGAGAATTAVDLLKAARVRLAAELRDRPDVAVELMTAVGYGLVGQGLAEEGAAIVKEALDLAAANLPRSDARRLDAATVYGEALYELDRPRETLAVLAPVIDDARHAGHAHALVDSLRWTSSAQLALGQLDAGVASAQAAVDAALAARPPLPRNEVATAWLCLANAKVFAQRPDAAEPAQKGLALMRAGQADRVTSPILDARSLYANALGLAGKGPESVAEMEAVLAQTRTLLGDRHPRVEYKAAQLANARLQNGDADGAIETFGVALAAAAAIKAPPFSFGFDHFGLGNALAAARRDDEAIAEYASALRFLEAAGPSGVGLGNRTRSVRAVSLARLGRLDDAEREFAALAGAPWSGLDGPANQMRLADLRLRQGRADEALKISTPAFAAMPADGPALGRAMFARVHGNALLAAGGAADAVPLLQKALDGYRLQAVESADRRETAELLRQAQAAAAPGASAATTASATSR